MGSDIKRVLTIAGSDSGGGAGIQADLKTFTALGCYGMSVVTAVTAQNTVEVRSIHEVPPPEVRSQLEAVLDDIEVDAVKTGMLANAAIIETVAEVLKKYRTPNIVVDPVMISKGGAHLLREDAVEALKFYLAPLATILTPNVPEAAALTGLTIDGYTDTKEIMELLHRMGPKFVLLKGGHFESTEATDYLFDGCAEKQYAAPRIATKNTHGTGCTYAAAIAAYLAQGFAPPDAVHHAKAYLTGAIMASDTLNVGHGAGPLYHGWNL
jgi:hydroxymethylpyrimidine/phosphomethylpyrimidine kinase